MYMQTIFAFLYLNHMYGTSLTKILSYIPSYFYFMFSIGDLHSLPLFKLCTIVPLLVVKRCNGTTTGLGYLEVSSDCPCPCPPLGSQLVSAPPITIGGERYSSSTDYNLNTQFQAKLYTIVAATAAATNPGNNM